MKIETRYICEICGLEYDDEMSAKQCESQEPQFWHIYERWEIGDYVTYSIVDDLRTITVFGQVVDMKMIGHKMMPIVKTLPVLNLSGFQLFEDE